VWTFIVGLATYADLFYLGLGAALVRFAAHHRATGHLAALTRLASVVFTAYVAIAVVLVVLGTLISPLVPRLFATGISPELASLATISCILVALRLAALFCASTFSGLLLAYERNDVIKWVMIAFTWLRFVLIPLSVSGTNALLSLAIIVAVTGWLEAGALAWFSWKVTGGLPVRFARPRTKDLRPLYAFGALSFLVQVASKLVSYSDTTVIGIRLGADAVTAYTLPLQLAEYCRYVVLGLVAVLVPRLTVMYARGEVREIGALLVRVVRLACFLGVFVNVNLALLGGPFLERWIGAGFGDGQAAWILLWLALAGMCQVLSTQVTVPFYQSMNEMRFPVFVLIMEAVVNLVGSILLAPRFGPAGVAFATFVPACAISLTLIPWHLSRQLNVGVRTLVRDALAPCVIAGCVVALALVILNIVIPSTSYLVVVLKGSVGAALATGVFIASFPREDRQMVFGPAVAILPVLKRVLPV
jgi:O-antigen/teichoic acid export membrane protein